MPDHKFELLNAYLDGELTSAQCQNLESHLEDCPECQAELESLASLAGMLAEAPLPIFTEPEQFAADLAPKLPRQPKARAASARIIFNEKWWLMPVGLLLVWGVFSAVTWGSTFMGAVNIFGLDTDLSLRSSISASALLGQIGLIKPDVLAWLIPSEAFLRQFFSQLGWQLSFAMLYLSFMALWWAQNNRSEPNLQFG